MRAASRYRLLTHHQFAGSPGNATSPRDFSTPGTPHKDEQSYLACLVDACGRTLQSSVLPRPSSWGLFRISTARGELELPGGVVERLRMLLRSVLYGIRPHTGEKIWLLRPLALVLWRDRDAPMRLSPELRERC